MISSSATRGGDSLAVDVASAAETIPEGPQPIPPTGYAIVSSISYRLEKLSLSDEPVLESPTTAICYPVYTATPAGTDPTPSKHSARPSLRNLKPKLFVKLSKGFKAGLQKSILKRGNTKKTGASIPPLLVSPCSPVEHEDSLIGKIVDVLGGLQVSDALKANPYNKDTQFHELFASTVRAPPTHQVGSTTFLQPASSDPALSTSSTLRTAGDEVADDSMDEDQQQPPSGRPESPVPMELEATSPSRDAILVPESPSVPSEDSTSEDIPASIPELRDEVMRDVDQCSSDPEDANQMEPADTIMIDAPSTESASSTLPSREINMDDAEDIKSSSPDEQETTSFVQRTPTPPASDERSQLPTPDTNPGRYSAPVNSANVAALELPPPSARTLPTVRPYQAAESSSAVGESRNIRLASTQRQVPLIESRESRESTLTSTAGASSTSMVVDEVVVPSTQETKSTAGPSTPTPASSQMNPTEAHASHVHKVLGKLKLSKQPSKSAKDEAFEEAEAQAFLTKLVSRRDPPKPQKNPSPSSKLTQTKGSASRSLMNDIMAGFGRATNSTPSRKPVTAATQPSFRPLPATTNALSISPTSQSTSQHTLPVVAGRKLGLNHAVLSSVVGSGRQVAASPSGRAPSTVSATGKVNRPPGSIPTQAGTPSEAAMDGVESARRVVKGSRRVARAMANTKVTWQMVQQKVQQTQAALEAAQPNAAASIPASSLKSEELRLSQQWHAAQPPPPPEAMAYINTDQEEYEGDGGEYDGDPDDIDAQIAWALSH